MSLTLVNNLRFPGVFDIIQKKTKSLKYITGVNDTADKFFGGSSDTGD